MRSCCPRIAGELSCLLVASLLLSPSLYAQVEEGADRRPPVILTAQQFLRTLYPEVSQNKHTMTVEAYGAFDVDWKHLPSITICLGKKKPCRNHADARHLRHPGGDGAILRARFDFGLNGQINNVIVHYPEIQAQDKLEKLVTVVNSNPSWQEAQIADALEEFGARYGPSDREKFTKDLRLEALADFIGPLKVESIDFQFGNLRDTPRAVILLWRVRAVSIGESGKLMHWSLDFEPFNGRLLNIFLSIEDLMK